MIDLHTHHDRCGHAEGKLEDYVQTAINKGIQTLGITDHSPLFHMERDVGVPGMMMGKTEFSSYVSEAFLLKETYKGEIHLLVGIEADYFPGQTEVYRHAFSNAELDYVIGSVHYLDDTHIFDKRRWDDKQVDPERLFAMYYDLQLQMVKEDYGDIIAHLDAFKAFAPTFTSQTVQRKKDALIEAIGATNKIVELNTSGLRKCGEIFPGPQTVRDLADAGATFTFGSDAHRPEEIGYGFEEARTIMIETGIEKFIVVNEIDFLFNRS